MTPAWGHTEVERAREQVPGRGRSRPRELDREDVRNPPRERREAGQTDGQDRIHQGVRLTQALPEVYTAGETGR